MMGKSNIDITSLSPHLFWDVDKKNIDFEKNKRWLINRVLEYGLYNDWLLIKNYYGIDKIVEIAASSRDISKKTASFLSAISGLSKEKFICFSTTQYHRNFWNY